MKKLTSLHLNSENVLGMERQIESPERKTEMKISGRASFIDKEASEDYMSYRGHAQVELNEQEIEEISIIAMKALQRLGKEVNSSKSGTDKD